MIDVERLKMAMHNQKWCKNEWLHERIHDVDPDELRTVEELVAEYERVTEYQEHD